MADFKKIIIKLGFMALALLLIITPSCRQGRQDGIPITTISKEARQDYIQARDLSEFFHLNQARGHLTQALVKDPDFALAHLYSALAATRTQDFMFHLGQAEVLGTDISKGEQLLIRSFIAFYMESNPVKAMELFEELAQVHPEDKRAHWYLSRAYTHRDQPEKAITALENALDIDKRFAPAWQDLGYCYTEAGDYKRAESAFMKYMRLKPKEPKGHDGIADMYTRAGRFEEAVAHYEQALEMDPDFLISRRKLGAVLIFMDKFEEGREAVRQAMEREQDAGRKVYDMERIFRSYLYQRDYTTALEVMDRTIQMAFDQGLPGEAARCNLAKAAVCCELKAYENAIQCMSDCLEVIVSTDLVPSQRDTITNDALFWQTMISANCRDFEKAYERADELKAKLETGNDPSQLKYHTALLGHIAMQQEDYTSACEFYADAKINEPLFLYQEAVAKAKAGNKGEANTLYRKVINWNSDSLWYALVRPKAIARE